MESRDDIRRRLRAERRRLDKRRHQAMSSALAAHILRSPEFRRAKRIAFYLPNDGEPDLRPLMARAHRMGKCCLLPVLAPSFHDHLWFARWAPGMTLVPNRFSIPEPVLTYRRRVPARAINLVLAPLVGFDHCGNRLGMGGGFYDRTFGYQHHQRCWTPPTLVGTAFYFQQVEELPVAGWDVPLQGIVTDNGWIMRREPEPGF